MKKQKDYTFFLLACLLAFALVVTFTCCTVTEKSGCGNYYKWEAKNKFNK